MATGNGRERRLAVILHMDVVDSTALVRRDETLAHTRITDAFGRFSAVLSTYGGTVREMRGDALVAEFARASDAVASALAAQAANSMHNSTLGDDICPQLRVGIALGEVVIADETVTGPGIVLAQRLEQLAAPGAVCVQGSVYEAVPERMPFEYTNLGEQNVKGFDEPVRAFSVAQKAGETIAPPESKAKRFGRSKRQWLVSAAVTLLVITAGFVGWLRPWNPQFEAASVARMTLPLPAKPSIAVLPFDVDSKEDEERLKGLADGFHEDIVSALSKLSEVFVISRGGTRQYRGKRPKISTVAEELGVRYIVEGTIRARDQRLLITIQLADALNARSLWTERYDRPVEDIFGIRDDVTLNIVSEIGAELTQGEHDRIMRRGTNSLEAWLLVREAAYRNTLIDPEQVLPAIRMAERAIEIDPDYASAYAVLGGIFRQKAQNWPGSDSTEELFARAEGLMQKALSIDDSLGAANMYLAGLHFARAEHDKAMSSAQRAVDLEPNNWVSQGVFAWVLNHGGRPRESIAHNKLAMRLNPNYAYWVLRELAHSHLLLGELDTAIAASLQVIDLKPGRVTEMIARVRLAIAYDAKGMEDAAREQIAAAREVYAKASISWLHRSRPYKIPLIYARWDPILRRLGLPE